MIKKLFSKKEKKPGNPNGSKSQRAKKTCQKVFGFEKVDREKYKKSPRLDEDMVVMTLAKLETDMNWVKRILWLGIAGGVGTQFIP